MKHSILSLIFFIGMMSSASLKAQTKVPVYNIMHGIDTNARAEFNGHPEWGFAELRKHITQRMPLAVKKNMKLPQMSSKTMSPQELYAERLDGALIFGKAYMCGECPTLHVSLIATATAVSEDGVCLTNYHVVHPIVSGDPSICKGDSVYFLADRDGQLFPLTHVLAYNSDEDAAVIRVDTRGGSLNAIPFGTPAETGQHINLISHPKQMVYTYTQGYVTRNTVYNYPGRPILDLMEISADFAEGSSGGPIMDDNGNLVAMVKGTTSIFYDAEKRNPQMVLKVTIPITSLKRLLGM